MLLYVTDIAVTATDVVTWLYIWFVGRQDGCASQWIQWRRGIIAPKVTDDWDTPTKTKCSPHRWPLLTFNIYNCWVPHGGGECWAGDGREFGAANTRHPCERTWVFLIRRVSIYLPHAGWDWDSHDSICFGMGLMGLRYYIYILWPFGQVEHIVENHHFSQYFTIFHHILETNITKISPKFPPYFGHRISTICQHLGELGWLVFTTRTSPRGLRNLSRQGAGHHLHRKWR